MSTRLLFAAFVMSLAVAGCARPTPEQQFINDAADALGGRHRIQAVKTLTIEGDGTNYNLGQDMKPDAATQQFAVTGYKRQIDLANRRQRVEQTRTPKFAYFQGPQPQKQLQGLDDAVAYNVNAAGAASRLAARAEMDRRADLYHHPLALVRAALDSKATVGNVRQIGTVRQGDVTIAGGPTVTMSLDAAGLPLSVSSKTYHANLGDVVITTTFAEYQDVNGLKLPAQFTGKVDRSSPARSTTSRRGKSMRRSRRWMRGSVPKGPGGEGNEKDNIQLNNTSHYWRDLMARAGLVPGDARRTGTSRSDRDTAR